jgi:hypothetical protein
MGSAPSPKCNAEDRRGSVSVADLAVAEWYGDRQSTKCENKFYVRRRGYVKGRAGRKDCGLF